MKRRVAIVGLGMAVAPHAASLVDLRARVDVAWAYSPSAARRAAFAARFAFRLCDRLETSLEDDSVSAVLIQKRRVMSSSSGFSSSSVTVSGSSAMPHFGHAPGWSWRTSGSMGQT